MEFANFAIRNRCKKGAREDMEDIKRCPFCGSEAKVYEFGVNRFVVECNGGCVRMPACSSSAYTSEENAINDWNTRSHLATHARAEILGAVARGWCSPKNSGKVVDPDLAEAITDEVIRQLSPIARSL